MKEEGIRFVNLPILEEKAKAFTEYVHAKEKSSGPISFADPKGFLAKEEGYKAKLAQDAKGILKLDEWEERWIGSGRIKDRVYNLMNMSQNIVNFNGVIDFKNHFVEGHRSYSPKAEKAIYEIYCGSDEEAAFNLAIEAFGAKYSLLAYLFFLKDETRFLPATPTNFERCFEQLGINFKMSFKCSWENYSKFLDIIREFREILPNYLDVSHEISLLDAHSFVWIIGEEVFINWRTGSVDINTPLRPKNKLRKGEGTIVYKCPRCEYSFIQASRCPECGQLIRE